MTDNVNHPSHYNNHPSGVECWDITRHENFNCGAAIEYIWRRKHKGKEIEDLEKAVAHLQDEIKKLRMAAAQKTIAQAATDNLANIVRGYLSFRDGKTHTVRCQCEICRGLKAPDYDPQAAISKLFGTPVKPRPRRTRK
jgi:hypothetical protein